MHPFKKRKLRDKIISFSVFAAFIVFAICMNNYREKMEDELRSNTAFARGEITRISMSKGHKYIYYEYKIKNKTFTGSQGDGGNLQSSDEDDLFLNKTFPLIYDSLDASYAHLLVFPAQFRQYGFQIPDYVSWIKKFHKPHNYHDLDY